jgi:hypothetical protein
MNHMQTTRLGFFLFLGSLGLIALSTTIVVEFKHTKVKQCPPQSVFVNMVS